MTVVFPSEYVARIAYRKYMRVRARGQRLRAVFSKPAANGTEAVDPMTAQQKEDAAVQMIAVIATRVGGLPYVVLDKLMELAARGRASGDGPPQGNGSARERRE